MIFQFAGCHFVSGDNSKNFDIHFLQLGNNLAGDCIFIDIGDTEIIIDAGYPDSAGAIRDYIDKYIHDGTIEYAIATHSHYDHISGFSGDKNNIGIFDIYKIGMIIDFPKINNPNDTYYSVYEKARDKIIRQGTIHYTALECFNGENGAKRVYDIGDEVKLEILYNWYYENPAVSDNDYSVCVRIVDGGGAILLSWRFGKRW